MSILILIFKAGATGSPPPEVVSTVMCLAAFGLDCHTFETCILVRELNMLKFARKDRCCILLDQSENDHPDRLSSHSLVQIQGSVMLQGCVSSLCKPHFGFCDGSINAEKSSRHFRAKYAAFSETSFMYIFFTKPI
ncbi:hypothetical protein ILYODFUR_031807 [Ilyodon furcidens]|uniref:Secreted protein n=1 Tax=Ilyodon furcidens TaxID=33524 RepID=A0ABV0V7T9_9TELE